MLSIAPIAIADSYEIKNNADYVNKLKNEFKDCTIIITLLGHHFMVSTLDNQVVIISATPQNVPEFYSMIFENDGKFIFKDDWIAQVKICKLELAFMVQLAPSLIKTIKRNRRNITIYDGKPLLPSLEYVKKFKRQTYAIYN